MSGERPPGRALTVVQPWAHLIVRGRKRVENRSWEPTTRGLQVGDYLAIHAGMRVDLSCWEGAYQTMPDDEAAPLRGLIESAVFTLPARAGRALAATLVPFGAIVGVARLAAVEDEAPEDGDYWCGPWGWRFDRVQAIEPVPCKGAQGLWRLPPGVLGAVRERWQAAREAASP